MEKCQLINTTITRLSLQRMSPFLLDLDAEAFSVGFTDVTTEPGLGPGPIPVPSIDHFWTTSAIMKSITFSIIIVVAAVGNLLVLIAVLLHPKIRATTSNYFVMNLAVADFLLAVTVAPFTAVKEIRDPFWTFGRVYCHIWYGLSTWYCSASILSLCAISIDRYIGVTHPLRYAALVTKRRAFIAIFMTWFISLLLSAPPLYIWPEWQPNPVTCNFNIHVGHVLTITLGSFYRPLVVLVGMYCKVYKVVRDYEKSLRDGAVSNNNNNNNNGSSSDGSRLRVHHGGYNAHGADSTSAGRPSAPQCQISLKCVTCILTRFQAEKRIALQLALVGGVFILCWSPFFTTLLVATFQNGQDKGVTPMTVKALKVTIWLGYVNSCLNPFIYVASSRQFRIAFRHMLCMKEEGSSTTATPTNKSNTSNSNISE